LTALAMPTQGRRRFERPAWVCLLACLSLCLLGADRPKGLADVREVRTWSYDDYTRVVVEMTGPVKPVGDDLNRLAANEKAKRPDRLYIDLEGVWVGRDYLEGIPVEDGLLEDVRLGQFTLTNSRLVIDLQRYGHHRMFTLEAPHRLVIDVFGERAPDRVRPERSTRSTPVSRTPNGRLPVASRPVRTVVIDAGHGGKDPGAIGQGGLREKDVNLKLARMLKKRLEARSFNVVMTRDDDRFIDLEERTVIAESAKGDVFISIHANASRRRNTRGIEIYYLDENHERHSIELAARENGIQPRQVDGLQRTLAKLRVSEASVHSRKLAEIVHENVMTGLDANYRSNSPDLGVKKGPFYVLFMSTMPSILVETGFLTNKGDARLLRSDRYLDTFAAQLASGLGRYRNTMAAPKTLRASRDNTGLPPVGAR
jgi:N-acetylmuramoyl-L-alanine amidase